MNSNSERINFLKKQQKAERDFYRKGSNIPLEYWDYKWISTDNESKFYDPKFVVHTDFSVLDEAIIESRTRARNEAFEYSKNIKEKFELGKSLVIIGGQRSGKTVLATLILREAINNLIGSVYFVPFIQLVVESNVYFKEDIEKYTAQFIDPDMLCIDDIDSIRDTSPKFKEYFDYILTSRRLSRKPTIITSRMPVSKMRSMVGNGVFTLLNDRSIYKHINILSKDLNFEDMDILNSGFNFDINKLVEKLREHSRKQQIKNPVVISSSMHNILKDCIVNKK